jgi:hypothetical protein
MKLNQLVLGILLLGLTGCATSSRNAWQQGTTTINVTGTPGARITGFYVQDGQRHPIASSVPFTLSEPGLSEAEIRKAILADTFTAETRFRGPEERASYANVVVPPGIPGVRVSVRKGFSVEHLRK